MLEQDPSVKASLPAFTETGSSVSRHTLVTPIKSLWYLMILERKDLLLVCGFKYHKELSKTWYTTGITLLG